ncbi:neutral zinc metallopeptidase [Mycolicibacterium sp. F2034L]|uniref:neutral zinc metallopeptidase n=1 Tax=Mycolicibacterium sp. F2034L TaxID=2926422 RepID=UPI001FF6225A|nr:neutral zinc metallopeptidase [Mycolicibacterium sp. F2034L]MCK0177382.1 neutral zinc metallopeptidase [Mycolicibacterium sp. F2034L]
MITRIAPIAATMLLTLTACGSDDETAAAGPNSTVTPVASLAAAAVDDLQAYWSEQFPALYGSEYVPLKGGVYALTASSTKWPECATEYADVEGNAFFCQLDDSVSWDAEGLLPELQANFGDFVIPVVLAHEWGHAVQHRSGFFDENALTVSSELQADCFAGAWSRHARDSGLFQVSDDQLDDALAGVLDLRDAPGTSAEDPSAHGSGFDRVAAFQDGYDNAAGRCKEYRDGEPTVLELPFEDAEEAASEGNAPYDSIVNGVPYDLEDYWTHVYPEITGGKPWVPLRALEPFDPANPPMCDGEADDDYTLFYCVPDDFVAWDNVEDMPEVYREGGDWAVGTLLATQYGLAALTRMGDQSDDRTSTLRSDCLAGSYTASVMLFNRAETSSFRISPGDLDEGITALLVFRGDGDVERQGHGFSRVRAYREGVLNGAEGCLTYQP